VSSVDEPVEIVAYDSDWPDWYRVEADRIMRRLGGLVVGIEHIGSTAVPTLASKPIIDIMLGVRRFDNVELVVVGLPDLGYEDCGGASGRRYFRRRGERAFNLQIVEHSGELWITNLAFRDYLRHEPESARAYAEAKTEAARTAPTLLAYSEAKRRGLEDLLERAREWNDSLPKGDSAS
jgi:GrpB-like predicted nucleotidyltransferase (UPF0157 family)